MRVAYIGAGSNLGDRAANLRGALKALEETPGICVAAVSALYETDPIGGVPQPAYLNLAARLETALTPESLLEGMQRIESAFGRDRTREIRWGPRTLDLDLLLFEDETRTTGFLTLPHPRMWERAFVLVPLHEVADAMLAKTLASSPANDPGVRRVEPLAGRTPDA